MVERRSEVGKIDLNKVWGSPTRQGGFAYFSKLAGIPLQEKKRHPQLKALA